MLNQTQKQWLVALLKEADACECLLNRFETRMLRDVTDAYAKFGPKLNLTDKQWAILGEVASKLCLDAEQPECPAFVRYEKEPRKQKENDEND